MKLRFARAEALESETESQKWSRCKKLQAGNWPDDDKSLCTMGEALGVRSRSRNQTGNQTSAAAQADQLNGTRGVKLPNQSSSRDEWSSKKTGVISIKRRNIRLKSTLEMRKFPLQTHTHLFNCAIHTRNSRPDMLQLRGYKWIIIENDYKITQQKYFQSESKREINEF